MHKAPIRLPSWTFPLLALVACPFMFGGCATYVKYLCHHTAPETTVVKLETTPPGAEAKLSNGMSVRTPTMVVLPSKEDVSVTFTKQGYKPTVLELRSRLDAWLLLDILVLPIFLPIDLEQGATHNLSPSRVHVDLEPHPPAPSPS
ncbi:MAG TPA: hypothetical protein VMT52_09665 [Planctomycetota bacterium]|nr:hypothetical protein [Planctomycetota bacterium]